MQTCSKLDLPTLSLIHHLCYPKKIQSNNIIFVLDSVSSCNCSKLATAMLSRPCTNYLWP